METNTRVNTGARAPPPCPVACVKAVRATATARRAHDRETGSRFDMVGSSVLKTSGTMLVRNSQWSRRFFREWMDHPVGAATRSHPPAHTRRR